MIWTGQLLKCSSEVGTLQTLQTVLPGWYCCVLWATDAPFVQLWGLVRICWSLPWNFHHLMLQYTKAKGWKLQKWMGRKCRHFVLQRQVKGKHNSKNIFTFWTFRFHTSNFVMSVVLKQWNMFQLMPTTGYYWQKINDFHARSIGFLIRACLNPCKILARQEC